jgi:hypothetical protein
MDAQLKAVQSDLITLGYLPKGSDDGTPGPKTTRAVKHFQRQAARTYRMSSATDKPDDVGAPETFKGPVTGVADPETLKEIKKWIDKKWRLPLGRFAFKKIANGTLREDVADEWTKLVSQIKGKGGTIEGPYGDTKRGLGKAKKTGASSFSFHIVGRAIDLQQELNDPPARRYQVMKDKVAGKIGYWRIYCKTDVQDGTQGKAYKKDEVKCWDFSDKKEYSLPADVYYMDLTNEIESGGMFERIQAQDGWETAYNKTEWWHFQYKPDKLDTFQDECELVGYGEKDLKNAGYSEGDMDRKPG